VPSFTPVLIVLLFPTTTLFDHPRVNIDIYSVDQIHYNQPQSETGNKWVVWRTAFDGREMFERSLWRPTASKLCERQQSFNALLRTTHSVAPLLLLTLLNDFSLGLPSETTVSATPAMDHDLLGGRWSRRPSKARTPGLRDRCLHCEARISNLPGMLCGDCRLGQANPHPQRTHPQTTARDSNHSVSATPSTSSATDQPQSQPQLQTVQLPRMPSRYPGDGLDFRRPGGPSRAHTSNPENTFPQILQDIEIVDLTNSDDVEQASAADSAHTSPFGQARRGPRFARDIIDLSEDSLLSQPRPHNQTNSNVNGSPEVEFISARRLPTPPRPPSASFTSNTTDVMDLTEEDDEDDYDSNEIEFVSETFVIRDNESVGLSMSGFIQAAVGVVRQAARQGHFINRIPVGFHPPLGSRPSSARGNRQAAGPSGSAHAHAHGTFRFATPHLDFSRIGFDLGLDTAEPPPPPPPPMYGRPSPAPDGFTRSGQENDVLICPNCDRELCSGDTDIRRQVWIIKGCGHVSCYTSINGQVVFI